MLNFYLVIKDGVISDLKLIAIKEEVGLFISNSICDGCLLYTSDAADE